MEGFGLRRTQSLWGVSDLPGRSKVMPEPNRWDRKSVLQLVQHYQGFGNVSSAEPPKLQVSESFVDARGKKGGSKENVPLSGSGRSLSLYRSRSMDSLPQKEHISTKALCALFESKASPQASLNRGPPLHSTAATAWKARGELPLQDRGGHNNPATQRLTQTDVGKVVNGSPDSNDKAGRYSHDYRYSSLVTKGDTPARKSRERISTSSSVRERSALYLARAAAIDSPGSSAQPEVIGTPKTKPKVRKMAEASRITVSHSPYDEEDLPPPPPPLVPPRPLDYEGPELSTPPPPPPKETFTAFCQQRQKSELKRLFKHIHPDLRAHLDDAVDDDIIKAVQPDGAQAADAAYQGEVQSMKWIFENWNLDNIGEPHETKKLLYDEELKGGDVRGTSSKFEHVENAQQRSTERQASVRGDVRTSMWLFETQPLDALNLLNREEGEMVEAVLKEPIQPGDVRGTRQLFESRPLSDLGRCGSIEDHSVLKLRSELQEQKGDIQKTLKVFQSEPRCAIRDNSGNIHEIKSICREEINGSNFNTARWLFETQPLDLIHEETSGVKIIRGISLEEANRGGVDQKRWMFETQSFDAIQEDVGADKFEGTMAECAEEADVVNKRRLFEMQPLAALKGDSTQEPLEKEEIIGGDVKTSLWLFETQPMETLKDNYEVGHLKKITLSADEQGEVKGKKQIFESCHTEKNTSFQQDKIENGDVKGFKHLFETIPLSKLAHVNEELVEMEKVDAANIRCETTPLYVIKDCSGNLHRVTTVSREEFIKEKFQNYRWMFETRPLDELTEGKDSVEIIKGITRQEQETGDVRMAKWLFETQTIAGIQAKFNQRDDNASEVEKGDVKTRKWLFETKPMKILHDKTEKPNDNESPKGADVKSVTWLFESQPFDSIRDGEEHSLKLCNTIEGSVTSEVDFQTAKHLFETESLDRIRKDANSERDVRLVSRVNFQSGDVSRVRELFESQSLDEIGSEMETPSSDEQNGEERVEKGSVHKFTWMFENCPMNLINKDKNEGDIQEICVIESGDVQSKKFIFETSSLDSIHDRPLDEKLITVEQPVSNVDVKSSTMMFESLPLYAIRDKEGQFHEVTTVKKEEVLSHDVREARWMFETKPLDAIKAENEVYVIRAVTQEDIKKGDVQSARWKFETQPLDSLTSRDESPVRVMEDIGSTSVQVNKEKFESNQCSKFVRMVSVTDVQHGDVRTSTWLFENQSIDSLKGDSQEESPVKTVHREDSQKGDVKRCTWLFESQPLDKIKESEDTLVQGSEEAIPKADVKCTTWLFETTPLDKITAHTVADTLYDLCQLGFIHSSGIIIEANESRNVNMAKYQFDSNNGVQIQKDELVGGNIVNIMLQLLIKPTLKPQISLLREGEKGKINTTVVELPVYQSTATVNLESDQRVQNIVQMINDLLIQDSMTTGIIMQETTGGQAEMSVYSLICNSETKTESYVRERGDVKSTIGNLLATANIQKSVASCKVDENEKGNVNLFKTCIEKGDLKSIHTSSADEVDSLLAQEQIEIVHGDVKEAKRSLCQQKEQVERTISDVLPGNVKSTKKVFSSEASFSVENCVPKEEIIPGDVLSAKQQLAVQPPLKVEKEDIVAGDIKAMMESLERAKQQSMYVEREIIKPGTIYDMDLSADAPEGNESQTQKEVIISGDVKAAKRSLEIAKQQSMHVERDVIVPGKIYNLNIMAQEESPSAATQPSLSPSSRQQPIKTIPKFQLPEREMCSACLTPVYPMEKMLANKLILHNNCFCCKTCKKKLSLHNYSSIYGEFYCTLHYKQLFKGNGNYDGFGNKLQKDQQHQKNRGIDEPDASSAMMTKCYLNMSDRSREPSSFIPKSSVREVGNTNSVDVQQKLKKNWPPEKNIRFESVQQQTRGKTRMSESLPGNNQFSIIPNEEIKNRVKTLSSSFTRGDQERPKMAQSDLRAEKILSKEMRRSDPAKTVLNPPMSSKENVVSSTIRTLQQKHEAPLPKTNYNPAPNRLNTDPNRGRKSVRFAQSLIGSQTEMSNQAGGKAEEQKSGSDQTESSELKDVSDKSSSDPPSCESRKEQVSSGRKNEVYLEIHEYESKNNPDLNPNTNLNPKSSLESDIRLESSQPDGMAKDKVIKTFETSTEKVVNKQELSEGTQVMPKDSVNPSDSENLAEQKNGEEPGDDKNKNKTENDQENSQKKMKAKTNCLKSSTNQAEKTKGKLGSWPTGKNPLSKLFTSGGTEKTNKNEPKEARKQDIKSGLLGRLFQSSSEKAEDTTKSTEKNDKQPAIVRNTDEAKDIREKEMEDDKSDFPPSELKVDTEKHTQSAGPKTTENDKTKSGGTAAQPSDLIQDSTTETKDDTTAVEQDQKPGVQNHQTDPSRSPSQKSEEKITPPKPESDEVVAEILNDDILDAGGRLASGDRSSMQVETVEAGSSPQWLNPSGIGPSCQPSQELDELFNPPKPESDGLVAEIFNADILDANSGLASGDQSFTQTKTVEAVSSPQLLNPSGVDLSQPPSQESETINPPKPESDEVVAEDFHDDIFNVNSGLSSGDHLSTEIKPLEAGTSLQLLNPSGVEGLDLFSGEHPDHSHEEVSDLFGEGAPMTAANVFSSSLTLSGATSICDQLDSQQAAGEAILNMNGQLPVPDSSQIEPQTSGTNIETKPYDADMDIFASNDILFFQSPTVATAEGKRADTSTNSSSVFGDNIFGDGLDVFMSMPPNTGTENSMNQLLGAAASSMPAPLVQTDLFSGDIFASEEPLLHASQASDGNLFVDNFLTSDISGPAAPSDVTNNSWMDDLLG